MGLINFFQTRAKKAMEPIVRSFLSEYLTSNAEDQGATSFMSDWATSTYSHSGSGNKLAVQDPKITGATLLETCREQVIFSSKQTISNLLFKKGYGFIGGKNTTKLLKEILDDTGYKNWRLEWLEAEIGTGGGNGLLIIEKDNKKKYKRTVRVEPFYADGLARVKVSGDDDTRQILGYEIWSAGRRIKTYTPDQVIQFRFSDEGNYKFGIGPAVVAARYYAMKKRAMAALQSQLTNIKKNPRFISPDPEILKDMESGERKVFLNQWNVFEEYVKANLNGVFVSPFPAKSENLQSTPQEVMVKDMSDYFDKVMGGAYLMALSTQGRSDGVNYANAEQNRDNASELVVEAIKAKLETLVTEVMTVVVPKYNPEKVPFYCNRELTEEDLKHKQLMIGKAESESKVILNLKKAGFPIKFKDGYFDDLMFEIDEEAMAEQQSQSEESNEDDEEVEKKDESLKKDDEEVKEQEKTEGKEEEAKRELNSSGQFIDKYIESKASNKAHAKIKKALMNQAKTYAH